MNWNNSKLESRYRLFQRVIIADNIDNDTFVWGARLRRTYDHLVSLLSNKERTGEGFSNEDFDKLEVEIRTKRTYRTWPRCYSIAMAKATQEQWNDWYRRILIKDLWCMKKLSTMCRRILFTVFGCMLAHDGAKHPRRLHECYVEYKYDGVRVIAIVQNNSAPYTVKRKLFNLHFKVNTKKELIICPWRSNE